MYLRRKIDDQLLQWLNTKDHSSAFAVGVRQCGKTKSVKHFAEQYFENLVYVNFWTTPLAGKSFDGELVWHGGATFLEKKMSGII